MQVDEVKREEEAQPMETEVEGSKKGEINRRLGALQDQFDSLIREAAVLGS